ncbi:MAG: hypothetical protein PUP90_03930 [Nostoc sp. S4]|nr:hypothetical protein [Nostoc sp. S4]
MPSVSRPPGVCAGNWRTLREAAEASTDFVLRLCVKQIHTSTKTRL